MLTTLCTTFQASTSLNRLSFSYRSHVKSMFMTVTVMYIENIKERTSLVDFIHYLFSISSRHYRMLLFCRFSQYMKLMTFMTISEAANAYNVWFMKLYGIVSTNKWLLGVVIVLIFLRGKIKGC